MGEYLSQTIAKWSSEIGIVQIIHSLPTSIIISQINNYCSTAYRIGIFAYSHTVSIYDTKHLLFCGSANKLYLYLNCEPEQERLFIIVLNINEIYKWVCQSDSNRNVFVIALFLLFN